jgi:hypothetical protein
MTEDEEMAFDDEESSEDLDMDSKVEAIADSTAR